MADDAWAEIPGHAVERDQAGSTYPAPPARASKTNYACRRESGREVREILDYPVFTAAPDAVGITSTGADGLNRLPDVLKAYRRFEAWVAEGAKTQDRPVFC